MLENNFEALGIDKTASKEAIKRAFRKLARQYHPDINPNEPKSGERFIEIQKAYNFLINNHERKIFTTSISPKNVMKNGDDINQHISISFFESFYGVERKYYYFGDKGKRKCLIININKGVENNQTICFKGKGMPGKNGGTAGDLYITVHTRKHPIYTRKGDDIYITQKIELATSIFGGEIKVPGIESNLRITIPPKTKDSTIFRLKHQGFFNYYSNKRANLFVKVKIKIPNRLNRFRGSNCSQIEG